MTPLWTVFERDVECGHASGIHRIPAGQPVRVITRAIFRCAEHAAVPVDEQAVDGARLMLDARRAAREAPAIPADQVRQPARIQLPRPSKPFSSLGDLAERFDPKAAAAGEPGWRD